MGLDSVELVMEVEKHFEIEIPDRVAATLFTVGLLHEFVVDELTRLGRPKATDVAFSELRELICYRLAVPPEQVIPRARFVEDLGID